jgi:adenylate cyclase, class 2
VRGATWYDSHMHIEIEAKFLQIDHDHLRGRLHQLSAVCTRPMRLMKRAILDFPDRRLQTGSPSAYVRVRDEGDRVTLTYKAFELLSVAGASEHETAVDSFAECVAIFQAIGLQVESLQESKRETWHFGDCVIELDEWPWLKPYIEIEGPSEAAIRHTARALDLNWADAAFGDVMVAYRAQYPGLSDKDTVGHLAHVRFGDPQPEFLRRALK